MTVCAHENWGQYSGETGAQPEPSEMIQVCAHEIECLTCGYRISVGPCEHPSNRANQSYFIAVNPPYEVR